MSFKTHSLLFFSLDFKKTFRSSVAEWKPHHSWVRLLYFPLPPHMRSSGLLQSQLGGLKHLDAVRLWVPSGVAFSISVAATLRHVKSTQFPLLICAVSMIDSSSTSSWYSTNNVYNALQIASSVGFSYLKFPMEQFFKCLFLYLTEGRGRGQRERETKNPKQASQCQPRARQGARTPRL